MVKESKPRAASGGATNSGWGETVELLWLSLSLLQSWGTYRCVLLGKFSRWDLWWAPAGAAPVPLLWSRSGAAHSAWNRKGGTQNHVLPQKPYIMYFHLLNHMGHSLFLINIIEELYNGQEPHGAQLLLISISAKMENTYNNNSLATA